MPPRPRLKTFAWQMALVFALWTLIGICSGLADYAFLRAIGRPADLGRVFRRPLTEQWVWAALTPLVFYLAGRVPLARHRLPRALALHGVFFVLMSILHCLLSDVLGGPLAAMPAGYRGSPLVLRFLEEFYSDIWMYWPLVVIRALLDARARERERERQANRLEQLMSGLKLSLLRAQIQPHFLFNTLHAISALLRVDPRAAEEMVADLAEILRASFSDATTQETSLQRELDLVGCYLRIQQRRFGERLMLDWRIAPDTLRAAVPALLLQSLVENAVVHGIAPLARPGTLSVSAHRERERLLLVVADDGAGVPAGHHVGVGLANVQERLAQLYGEAHSFALRSDAGHGTRIDIALPYRHLAASAAGGPHDEDTHADRRRRAAGAAEPVVAP